MNLIITDYCNRACPYCFAQTKVKLANGCKTKKRNISLNNVDKYLDFLERSNIREFKILGGEPALHPQLTEIIEKGIQRNLYITIFTNGLWPSAIQRYFRQQTYNNLAIIFNVNEPSLRTAKENAIQQKSMQIVGRQAMLGFNLYHQNFDFLFVIDLIDTHGLKREVRIGLASPTLGFNNDYISNSRLPVIGTRLIRQLAELEKHDILGSLDCGFPLCMFKEKDLGKLIITTTKGLTSACGNVIDVGPDLHVWPCFPLAEVLNVNLMVFTNREELDQYYNKRLAGLRSLGSMGDCITCKYLKRGQCSGGCLARTIRSLEDAEGGDSNILEKINALA